MKTLSKDDLKALTNELISLHVKVSGVNKHLNDELSQYNMEEEKEIEFKQTIICYESLNTATTDIYKAVLGLEFLTRKTS